MTGREPFILRLPAHIRACTADDLEALEWFGRFTAHRDIIRQAFAAQTRGEGLMLVLDVNRFPAGQVWIDLAHARARETGLLWAVRVFPPLRSLGLGGRLVGAAEHALCARGYDWSELGVERGNARARQFYRRAGYSEAGEERGWFSFTPPGTSTVVRQRRDEIIMRKSLAGASAPASERTGTD